MKSPGPCGPPLPGDAPAPEAASSPQGRLRVELSAWNKALALTALLASIALLILGVEVGVQGNLGLSDLLAFLALIAMGTFAGLNLLLERAWARRAPRR